MDPQGAFGEILRILRTERGITLEELAFRSHLHRTYISLLERGLRGPTLGAIFAIAAAMGIAPSEIVRLTESRLSLPSSRQR